MAATPDTRTWWQKFKEAIFIPVDNALLGAAPEIGHLTPIIAIFGTFITIITWKLWGLGNVIFYENESLKETILKNESLKETILSSTHSIQQQPPRPQTLSQHPQTLSQQQLKQPIQSQQSVLHEDRQNGDLKKRNVSTTLPTASITKRSLPLVPVNPYGFLSPSQSPSQSISSDDHVD